MTRPTKNRTIKNGIIVRVLIFMMSLPTAYTRSSWIAFRKWCIATYCRVSMRRYPTFAPPARGYPFSFNCAIRKWHYTHPLLDSRTRIILLLKWLSRGRIGYVSDVLSLLVAGNKESVVGFSRLSRLLSPVQIRCCVGSLRSSSCNTSGDWGTP